MVKGLYKPYKDVLLKGDGIAFEKSMIVNWLEGKLS